MQLRAGKFRVAELTGEYPGTSGTAEASGIAEQGAGALLIPDAGVALTYEGGHRGGGTDWADQLRQQFQPGQVVDVIFTDET